MVVWDIGANVGAFTFAAAHKAGALGSVVAVEADPFLATLLQRSSMLDCNRDVNVSVVCAAASDAAGVARLRVAQRGRSSNSLEQTGERSQSGGTRYVLNVPTVTLDSLLGAFPAPGIVKIDVEGAEPLVLQGAERLLSECRPIIYVEVSPEHADAVTGLLRRCGYRLFDGEAATDVEVRRCVFNTLALPGAAPR